MNHDHIALLGYQLEAALSPRDTGSARHMSSYHWQRQLKAAAGDSSDRAATSPVRELLQQVRELKRALADKTLEVDFFRGALQKIEARRQGSKSSGGTASTTRSGR
jgi:hypothetical protein